MKFTWVLRGFVVLALSSTAVCAQAATQALYTFTASTLDSADTDLGSTASAILLDTGLDGAARFAAANGNPAPAMRVNANETDGTAFAAANTANDDFTFSLTPTAGSKLVLNTLSFDLAVSNGLLSTNVRVQLGTNSTVFVTLASITDFGSTAFTAQSFDLSAANSALASGLPVYVRFLVFDNLNTAGVYTAFDNITVVGTTVLIVPEPSPNALLATGALGLMGVVAWRRRGAAV